MIALVAFTSFQADEAAFRQRRWPLLDVPILNKIKGKSDEVSNEDPAGYCAFSVHYGWYVAARWLGASTSLSSAICRGLWRVQARSIFNRPRRAAARVPVRSGAQINRLHQLRHLYTDRS